MIPHDETGCAGPVDVGRSNGTAGIPSRWRPRSRTNASWQRHASTQAHASIQVRAPIPEGIPPLLTVDFDRMGVQPGDRVLDLGCGAGLYTQSVKVNGEQGW